MVKSRFNFTTVHINAITIGVMLFLSGLICLAFGEKMAGGVCFGALATMGRTFAGSPDNGEGE